MEFNGINLNEATLDQLQEIELEHTSSLLLRLGMTGRLCSWEGKEVIAEYGLEGNFDEVVEQLKLYHEAIEDIGFDEITARCMIARKQILLEYRENMDSDTKQEMEKYNAVLEAVRSNETDPIKKRDQIIATALEKNQSNESQNVQLRMEALHDAGMCECFTN